MRRAVLVMLKNGPQLVLCDENEQPRVMLVVSNDDKPVGLAVRDENAKLIWTAP
ncbi:MAG: hypothetical protein JRE23_17000 [Deltaproteobacteria bacterium]|nr:hypothetical protein [Deltaproteobacteria bacterium]